MTDGPPGVLDVHAHHTRRGYIAESWWESLGQLVQRVSATQGRAMSHRAATEMFAGRLEGMSGDALVAGMDEAGIGRMVLLPLDYGLVLGEPPLSVEQQNEETAELCARHPERLVPFCGVDPMRGERALALIERMVTGYGARGVKLHPLSGWYPDDRAVYSVYEKCVSLEVPVLIHSGSDPPPLRSKYGRPIHLDDVCIDFPELRIMCAHMGKAWREEAVDLAERHPNLWLGRVRDGGAVSAGPSRVLPATARGSGRARAWEGVLRERLPVLRFGRVTGALGGSLPGARGGRRRGFVQRCGDRRDPAWERGGVARRRRASQPLDQLVLQASPILRLSDPRPAWLQLLRSPTRKTGLEPAMLPSGSRSRRTGGLREAPHPTRCGHRGD